MSYKHLMTGLMLCLISHTLFATSDSICGTINDETGSPLEFANVALFTASDSTLVDGAVTDSAGRFRLSDHGQTCYLRISALGYPDMHISNPHGDIGTINLTPATLELGEIVVKGRRPVALLKPDGLQVAISGTYLAKTGTALEVIGKLPFVTATESAIEVIGKGTPVIYINGRQVHDTSELNQLASSDIKNVDIVTSPGARYDSSVNAVIRISTITPSGEGFSLNDRTTIGYKHYVYLFEQADLNFRQNGFDFFGTLNYENYRERPANDTRTIQYLTPGRVEKNDYSTELARYPVYQGKIGVNYNTGNHFSGLYYDFSYRPADIKGSSITTRLVNSIIEDNLTYRGSTSRHNRQHLLSAYYTGTVGKCLLSANFDVMWQINSRNTAEHETSDLSPDRIFATHNHISNRLIAGNSTVSIPVWKGDLRGGTEVNDILRRDIYLSNADFISANDTRITETTCALFAETSQSINKISATVGLRWEYTDSRHYLSGERQTDSSRAYHNLAPNAAISFPIGQLSANLTYARKTTRPAFEQLSSAIRYLDRYSYESGNPELKPIYRDYISLSGRWRDLIVELTWYATKNYFMWQTTPYNQSPGKTDITLLKMKNMPRFDTYEAIANYAPHLFEIWHPTFMAGIIAQNFSLNHNGKEIRLDHPTGIFRFNNSVHLPADIWLDIDLNARTSGNGDNLYVKSQWDCNLGLYKSFAHDTWTLKIQLNDVFGTSRRQFTIYDAISTNSVCKHLDTRDLSITLRYNFNPARSRYRGRGAANSEKSRL